MNGEGGQSSSGGLAGIVSKSTILGTGAETRVFAA